MPACRQSHFQALSRSLGHEEDRPGNKVGLLSEQDSRLQAPLGPHCLPHSSYSIHVTIQLFFAQILTISF